MVEVESPMASYSRRDGISATSPAKIRKRDCGAMAYLSGCAAEASVARRFTEQGFQLLESRWRGQAGEIDLIFRDAVTLIFVEVKKARSFDAAAERLSMAQARRVHLAASEYLEHVADGCRVDMRFDLALVNQAGEVEIREAAFSHF